MSDSERLGVLVNGITQCSQAVGGAIPPSKPNTKEATAIKVIHLFLSDMVKLALVLMPIVLVCFLIIGSSLYVVTSVSVKQGLDF